jgi:hypothetical protein
MSDMCTTEDISLIKNNKCIKPIIFRIGRPYNIAMTKNLNLIVFDRMNGIYSINNKGELVESNLPIDISYTANISYNFIKDEVVFANHYENLYILSPSNMKILHQTSLPWKNYYDFDDGYVSIEYDLNEYWIGAGHGKRIAIYNSKDYSFKGHLKIEYKDIYGAYLRWYRPDSKTLIILSELGIYKFFKNFSQSSYELIEYKFYPSFFHEIFVAPSNNTIYFSNFLINTVNSFKINDIHKIQSYYTDKGPRWLVFDNQKELLYVSNYSE